MEIEKLKQDNRKLVDRFGARRLSKDVPDFYTFKRELIYSHRDFDKFFKALKRGEKCAILSGFNASGTMISDDESYVTGKVKTQEEALKNSMALARELLAYGFDAKKTYFIIDQVYTNIYNLAFKLSTKVNYSEIKATYGYKPEENIGTHFYPAVQSAHILFPQEKFGIKNVLVPIGPDEDAHIRISRDIAKRAGYNLPSILHALFLPGIDGEKMSKSKNNAIFLKDDEETILRKVNRAFSGGAVTLKEHREKGGNPEKDVACLYLSKLFLKEKESEKLISDYKAGKILSKDIKKRLADELIKFTKGFQSRLKKISARDVDRCVLKNRGQ